MIKRINIILILVLCFNQFLLINLPIVKAEEQEPVFFPVRKVGIVDPKINSKSAILIDADSQEILYQKNANAKIPVASLTKIMTAIVVLENYQLNQYVKVTSRAARQIPTKMWLKKNEKILVKNLLWGLLLNSANDAAFALAILASPKQPKRIVPFLRMMNAKAKAMGLENTSFRDPAGLNDWSKSSAFDLAKLTIYAMKNPTFAKMVKTRKKTVYSVNKKRKHILRNTNKLIQPTETVYIPQAIGVKTGYTEAAGQCLIGAVDYNGHIMVSVILHTNYMRHLESTKISRKLLRWGMSSFEWELI